MSEWVAAIVEGQLPVGEFSDPLHAVEVATALLDHFDVINLPEKLADQFRRHVGATGSRVVVGHDG